MIRSGLLTLSSIASTTATQLTYTFSPQFQYSSIVVDLGTDFTVQNICVGKTIFGRAGSGSCTMSNVFRTAGSTQLSQAEETITYAGSSTPTLPTDYNEVPLVASNDDGYNTTDADPGCANGCTSVTAITSAEHGAFQNCGTTQSTITGRISDCATINGSTATWNGGAKGISGESTWKLVTRTGANLEVWQDQRTGLLWSSLVSGSDDWCKATGNAETFAGADCSPNVTSYCVEILAPALGSENWVAGTSGTYTYDNAKGGLGTYSTPAVKWRLPTLNDFEQANIDGIRFVMPDMGALSPLAQTEWTATLVSNDRTLAWRFYSATGQISPSAADRVTATLGIRCVGR